MHVYCLLTVWFYFVCVRTRTCMQAGRHVLWGISIHQLPVPLFLISGIMSLALSHIVCHSLPLSSVSLWGIRIVRGFQTSSLPYEFWGVGGEDTRSFSMLVWVVTSCRLVSRYWYFEGTYCCPEDRGSMFCKVFFFSPYKSTQCYFAEDQHWQFSASFMSYLLYFLSKISVHICKVKCE